MALVPAMHSLMIAVIIPTAFMPTAFMAVLFVTLAIIIFVFVVMFVATAPVSMTFLLGKNHAGAERQYCDGEDTQPFARFHEFPSTLNATVELGLPQETWVLDLKFYLHSQFEPPLTT
jgi:hypothetical protein